MVSLAKCLLVSAVLVASVTCQELEWWKTTTFYQVYPRSFKDSDRNGVGDIEGIRQKLDYFTQTGISAIWISPMYPSPNADFGYDISNFTDIDPLFGSLDAIKTLFQECKSRGIKVVMDFVPNHSSDEHEWFVKSSDPTHPEYETYKDYYVWVTPEKNETGHPIIPNNWQSIFGGPAWNWHEARQQFYLHQFHPKQPDLNYRNPAVVEEMKEVLRFWLDLGIDGFRMDAVQHMVEAIGFPDEAADEWGRYRVHQPETYEIIKEFRKVVDNYSQSEIKVMMTEAYGTVEQVIGYYGNETNPGAHFSFNFILITDLNENSNATEFKDKITGWLNALPDGLWSNWVIGNHDQHRVGSRYDPDLVDGLNMLVQLLPGTAVTYYGEEIGMLDNLDITYDEGVDPQGCNDPDHFLERSRDPERTPFQWDATNTTGFTDEGVNPWLPINKNHLTLNLAAQQSATKSHYKVYQNLLNLRLSERVQKGTFEAAAVDDVFTFVRSLDNSSLVVAVNLGLQNVSLDLTSVFPNLEQNMTIHITSVNSLKQEGDIISVDDIILEGKEAIVLMDMSGASTFTISIILLFVALFSRLFI